jgi:hypothetical protein
LELIPERSDAFKCVFYEIGGSSRSSIKIGLMVSKNSLPSSIRNDEKCIRIIKKSILITWVGIVGVFVGDLITYFFYFK